ncbi:MAG: Tad domain-containing protein [Nitratireductor sp.]|nr:Tad domain-containing protein [Nitratireductor sp.]
MTAFPRRFGRDERGNFATILGLTIVPVLMFTGVAVDYSGFKRLESRMNVSAEAAMLAATKEVVKMREQDYADDGNYDYTNDQLVDKLDAVFKPHFEANFEAGGYDLDRNLYNLEYIEVDNVSKLRITINYPTAFMQAFGHETLTTTKEMIINLKVQPRNYAIDIVMCIDATGSMQNTLDGVQASAKTFNKDLRTELGVGEASQKLKIRVRPIFYRDWEEGRDYNSAKATYDQDMVAYEQYLEDLAAWEASSGGAVVDDGGGLTASERQAIVDNYNRQRNWYYQNRWGSWKLATAYYQPHTHKRISYENKYYYFRDLAELNDWLDSLGGGGGGISSTPPPTPVAKPTEPVNHGLNMYDDFIDLDPSVQEASDEGMSTAELRNDRNLELEEFLGSTYAFGGHDWPEAAGACLNEAVRSDWFDNQSDASRDYFQIPASQKIIAEGEPIPSETYTKVTPIPVVVFWSDATINSLQLSRDYLSSTTPTSWTDFQALWTDSSKIRQDHKMFIRFGPESASGFNTIMTWDRTYYGGSLSVGNTAAVKVIAKKILDAIPDLLRVGS